MPKLVDYPRAPLQRAVKLARAVDSLGGTCTIAMAADKSGQKVSGAFNAVVGAAVKYGLVDTKKGKIETTPLFRDFKLAYTEDDANHVLQEAFLRVPIFQNVATRFRGREVPIDHLDKLLAREFDVPDNLSSRVANYFVEGARETGIIDESGRIAAVDDPEQDANGEETSGLPETPASLGPSERDTSRQATQEFHVRITGPGIDSNLKVQDADDLEIVNVMLNKIRRKLEQRTQEEASKSSE